MESLLRFCHAFHLVPLPASSSTISCFLVYLSQHTSSYRYTLNHLISICVIHLYYDLPCDAWSRFSVHLTTMGLKRLLGTHTNQKHPVTLDLLGCIYGLLDTSIASQSALWCLFLIAFFSFLRKSNLTAPSAQKTPDARWHYIRLSGSSSLHPLAKKHNSTVRVISWYLCLSFPVQSSAPSWLFGITSVWFPRDLVPRSSV